MLKKQNSGSFSCVIWESRNNSSYYGPEQKQQSSHCMRQCSPSKCWAGRFIVPLQCCCWFHRSKHCIICLCMTHTHPLFFLVTSFPLQTTSRSLILARGISFFCLGGICSNHKLSAVFSTSCDFQAWFVLLGYFFFFIKLYIVVRGSFMLEPSDQGNSTCRCHAWQLKRFGDWTYLSIEINE